MRNHVLCSLILAAAPLYPAAAQQADSAAKTDSLRHRIEERFAVRVQEELGLTNEQTAKLRATSQRFSVRRRELHARHRQLREALSGQLRPGVAANQDSVAKLTDAMIELRVASAQATRDEMREVAKYLTPVQRARFFVMRDRLHHHMKEAREHRGMRGGREGRDRWKGHERGMGEPHE
ncbi:MAG TPA: Spy/CpxP family protein refolding chaperone [Gemmatimonadales bacterium]|jgi:Spy/CpxP family protein refolding chaperone|nr:Spy/CpxP family protein refolding chaperone [Gemmatimonadales bacterium]